MKWNTLKEEMVWWFILLMIPIILTIWKKGKK